MSGYRKPYSWYTNLVVRLKVFVCQEAEDFPVGLATLPYLRILWNLGQSIRAIRLG